MGFFHQNTRSTTKKSWPNPSKKVGKGWAFGQKMAKNRYFRAKRRVLVKFETLLKIVQFCSFFNDFSLILAFLPTFLGFLPTFKIKNGQRFFTNYSSNIGLESRLTTTRQSAKLAQNRAKSAYIRALFYSYVHSFDSTTPRTEAKLNVLLLFPLSYEYVAIDRMGGKIERNSLFPTQTAILRRFNAAFNSLRDFVAHFYSPAPYE